MLPLVSQLPFNLGDPNTRVGVSLAAANDVVDESTMCPTIQGVSVSVMTLEFTEVLECLPL